ncbi:MAG: hypothetical protein LBR28_04330 [Bacteroidales bacterium]|jgi:competence protein ComGC|nr:hypothetical protein [Bacteroidales bacterium]
MYNSILIVVLVLVLIVSKLVFTSIKKAIVNQEGEKEWNSIFTAQIDDEDFKKKQKHTSKIQGVEKNLIIEKVNDKEKGKPNELDNKEKKFSLKEAVIYNAILERPYK